jgi:uncharacterized protein YjgD (DUF1641 family)
MNDPNVLARMDALEQKLDLILEYVNQQRLQTEVVEDFVSDAVIIGKDFYNYSVIELEKQDVEFDSDELKQLSINLVKNVHNFNEMLYLLESVMDLKKDALPIANEVILEFSRTLNKMEQKGYFEFAKELAHVMDNVVTNFSADDIRQLADNIVFMLQTVKNVTQPDMLMAVNNAIKVYGSIQTEDIKPYSIWKMLREMKSPEMKSALGFMVAFMKNLSKQNIQSTKN